MFHDAYWLPYDTYPHHSRSPTFPSSVADRVLPAPAALTRLAMTSTDVPHLVASAHVATPTAKVTAREAPAETTTTIALDSDRHPAAGLPMTTQLPVAATMTRIAGTTPLQTHT